MSGVPVSIPQMFRLPEASSAKSAGSQLGLTFRESRLRRVHSWYPYVEGFSASYVETQLLEQLGSGAISNIYDPFGGAGTTQLVATCMGIPAYYSEINPLMAFVTEAKVTAARWCKRNLDITTAIVAEYVGELVADSFMEEAKMVSLADYQRAFPGRDFFEEKHLRQLLAARDIAHRVAGEQKHILALLQLACVANAVPVSNMTRRADLRRRRPDEYKKRTVNVRAMISQSLQSMLDDLSYLPTRMERCSLSTQDCRTLKDDERRLEIFDMAITSPPYLNGTNYFRNTKIELWLMGMLTTERELGNFRARAVTAGINDVGRNSVDVCEISEAESVAQQLDACAKDRRIPRMVRSYFTDMTEVFEALHHCLRPRAEFILDIGDSRFYGVHVPTDRILADIGQQIGFKLRSSRVLAERRSRDKTPLVQVELRFVKDSS
jgi:hypothetical protein